MSPASSRSSARRTSPQTPPRSAPGSWISPRRTCSRRVSASCSPTSSSRGSPRPARRRPRPARRPHQAPRRRRLPRPPRRPPLRRLPPRPASPCTSSSSPTSGPTRPPGTSWTPPPATSSCRGPPRAPRAATPLANMHSRFTTLLAMASAASTATATTTCLRTTSWSLRAARGSGWTERPRRSAWGRGPAPWSRRLPRARCRRRAHPRGRPAAPPGLRLCA
mmetsp:Transcript_12891/g.43678  ORF Transcript_12891/g.43678 Transcript_12891/m.43678 type:complete len:221 (+) Transcript_12891:1160-1822(+)